jgi:glycosyltransferase involved in cell wall biosynthesis
MKEINILIPTYNRPTALAVTLTSLCFQEEKNFSVIISDQSPTDVILKDASVQTAISLLNKKGNEVTIFKNLPNQGLAHQRQFLLEKSNARYCLFIDDDLILEPYVIKNLRKTLEKENCGFAGCAVIGLSYINDYRPHEQHIELWEGNVFPETVLPSTPQWKRHKIHNAANILHIEEGMNILPESTLKYKVAWVGGCVMYDRQKLLNVGGFSFWVDLPEKHCGEDVLAQLRVMKKYGGCGIIPSGVYHQELETTVPDRKINAPEFLEI